MSSATQGVERSLLWCRAGAPRSNRKAKAGVGSVRGRDRRSAFRCRYHCSNTSFTADAWWFPQERAKLIRAVIRVQRLLGVKDYERASKAVLVTTTYFSKDAQKFAREHEYDLKDYDALLRWSRTYAERHQRPQAPGRTRHPPGPRKTRRCPTELSTSHHPNRQAATQKKRRITHAVGPNPDPANTWANTSSADAAKGNAAQSS